MMDAVLDLRTEVDAVNRMGRRVVQQKQVDKPEELGKRLDDMKQRYSLLVANVTSVKEDLEKAEEVLRKFHHEISEVVNFLSTTEDELDTWESGEPSAVMQDEMLYVEVFVRLE